MEGIYFDEKKSTLFRFTGRLFQRSSVVFLLKSSQVNDDGNSMANTGGSITAFGSSDLQKALILLSETRPLQFLSGFMLKTRGIFL